MAIPLSRADRRGLRVASLFYLVYFGAFGILAPFFNVYLDDLGLSGVQIGWLASIPPIIALLANPFWGAISDRWKIPRHVLVGLSVATGITAIFFIPASTFVVLMILVVLLYFFRTPIPSIADSAVMSVVSRTGASYGRSRMWGSFGFVLTSVTVGMLLSIESMDMIFWLYALTMIFVLAALGFLMPVSRNLGRVNLAAGVRTMASNVSYRGFLLAAVLTGIGYGSFFNFLGLHILDMGGSAWQVGVAYGVNSLAEVPIMFLGARWFARYSYVTMITVGFWIFVVGYLTVALITSPAWLVVMVSAIGVGYGVYWVAAVGYADQSAPTGMGATAQATISAAEIGLGRGLGALVGGIAWDLAGGSAVIWVGVATAAAALMVFRVGMRRAHD